MFKFRTAALFGLVIVLVAALSVTAYIKIATPAVSASDHSINSVVQAPASLSRIATVHVTMNEHFLRSVLDDAYERHQNMRVQEFLHILNGRYEHRCCGLPR